MVQQVDMLSDYIAIVFVDIKAMVNRGGLTPLWTMEQMRRMPSGQGQALQERLKGEAMILEESNSALVPILILNNAKQALRSIHVDKPSIDVWIRDGNSSPLAMQVRKAMRAVRAVKLALLTGRTFDWKRLHDLCQRSRAVGPAELLYLAVQSEATAPDRILLPAAALPFPASVAPDSSDSDDDLDLHATEMQTVLRESRSWFPEDADRGLEDSELGDANTEEAAVQQSWCAKWCPCVPATSGHRCRPNNSK